MICSEEEFYQFLMLRVDDAIERGALFRNSNSMGDLERNLDMLSVGISKAFHKLEESIDAIMEFLIEKESGRVVFTFTKTGEFVITLSEVIMEGQGRLIEYSHQNDKLFSLMLGNEIDEILSEKAKMIITLGKI